MCRRSADPRHRALRVQFIDGMGRGARRDGRSAAAAAATAYFVFFSGPPRRAALRRTVFHLSSEYKCALVISSYFTLFERFAADLFM